MKCYVSRITLESYGTTERHIIIKAVLYLTIDGKVRENIRDMLTYTTWSKVKVTFTRQCGLYHLSYEPGPY